MNYYEVAPNKIIRAGSDVFTYASRKSIKIGQLVEVEVGKKTMLGVIIHIVNKPEYNTREILTVLDLPPLPKSLVATALWMSQYYMTPLAQVLQTILPRGITRKRREKIIKNTYHTRNRTNFLLNKDQLAAIQKIDTMPSGTALLHGVTGSGKTAVYIETAKKALATKRSVIILVPEIALTSQLVAEFSHHFDDIILTHSRQTESERHQIWQKCLTSSNPQIVIGPRSALFMPVPSLGLVIIDECHEPSFKQEQSPRYNALRVGAFLTEKNSAKLVLGSATPLISDYHLAKQAHRPIINLPKPAQPSAIKPHVELIDMTKRNNFKNHRFFSDALLSQLKQTLENGEQALIFHNRRGSASVTLCENCGWQAGCPRCFIPLTLHADKHKLICHICGFTTNVPTSCPECGHADIIFKGIGTKLIESELKKLFPRTAIARFDGDTNVNESADKRYGQLYDGSIQLIIGTQVIAKGFDLPHLRTVGVIQADAGLALPDFSAPERTFQLLAQVVGRVGRSNHETTVIVQSYQPSNPAVTDGISQNYQEFYERTIKIRQATHFPPFTFLAKLTCIYKTEKTAIANAKKIADLLHNNTTIEILGPTPAFYERTRDTYRWQLVLRSTTRAKLIDALIYVPPKNWHYELDPISLL